MSPCFPEKYRIFHVIWQQYHENLAFMMDCMGACAQQLANGDILKVTCSALPEPSMAAPAASASPFCSLAHRTVCCRVVSISPLDQEQGRGLEGVVRSCCATPSGKRCCPCTAVATGRLTAQQLKSVLPEACLRLPCRCWPG